MTRTKGATMPDPISHLALAAGAGVFALAAVAAGLWSARDLARACRSTALTRHWGWSARLPDARNGAEWAVLAALAGLVALLLWRA